MNENRPTKKYAPPKLEVYGDIRAITLAVAMTGNFDGDRSDDTRRTQT